jgi:hypothetical protein
MAKERTPTSYLDDWGKPSAPAPEVDNAGCSGGKYDYNVPYRAEDPETKDWSPQNDGATYGHSSDVAVTKGATWGMSKEDIGRGYERPGSGDAGKPGEASYPASVPNSNEWDRSDRSREFSKLEEGHHSGHDGARSSPGTELIGSSKLVG